MKTFVIASPISFDNFMNHYYEGDEINISSHHCLEKDSVIFLYFKDCSRRGIYTLCRISFTQRVLDDIAINKAVIERKEPYPMITEDELLHIDIDTKILYQKEIDDENDKQALFYLMDRFKPYIMSNCLKAEEVAKILDVSLSTLNYWYTLKKHHPNNPYMRFLPDYIQIDPNSARYWPLESIKDLFNFKTIYPYNKKTK